jgi:hypothetical protein
MEWEKWPLYVQKRHALAKTVLKDPATVRCAPLTDNEAVAAREVVEWMYGVLTILDAKASALMRLNGVLIAAAAFMLGVFRRPGGSILSTTNWDAAVIVSLASASAFSIFCCLLVVNISWPFLGKVAKNHNSKTFDFADEIDSLDKASRFRQNAYQLAWWISSVASIGFLGEFLKQAVHVISFAWADTTP